MTPPRVGDGATVPAAPLAPLTRQLGSAQEARWILEHGGDRWRELADRRLAGEPLQYVLGTWSFRHLELTVDRRVLIPRPETEQVVEVALAELTRICTSSRPDAASPATPGKGKRRVCVDLGTGSGAIALSLATEGAAFCDDLDVWATDISAQALAVAEHNRAAVDTDRGGPPLHLAEGSWFAALPPGLAGRVDLVVSNPPYVPEADFAGLDPSVRDWEPRQALVAAPGTGGVGGMAAIEEIIGSAPAWLRPGGSVVVEIDPAQASAAEEAAARTGFARVAVEPDLSGRDRMLVAQR